MTRIEEIAKWMWGKLLDGLGIYLALMEANGVASSMLHLMIGAGVVLWLT